MTFNFFKLPFRESGSWRSLLFHSSWSLTLASGLSYFFGFLRDRLFAHTFGLSRALDIYNAAFTLPDLLINVLIGTALSAAFLPVFSKCFDEKKELGYKYVRQLMSWGILIISIAGIITAIILPYLTDLLVPGFQGEDIKQYILLTRILLISPILFTISNIYGRILLSLREFLWYGLSPAFYNIGIITGVLVFVPKMGITGLIIGTLLGISMHLLIRLIIIKKPKYDFKHKPDFSISPEIKETLKLMAPKMVQYFMWSILLISFTAIASELGEGDIAAYNYARNFQSLPVSMLGIAIALAMYSSLSHDAGKGNFTKFKRDFQRDRARALFYTILAGILLAIISKPMITLLLGGGKFSEENIILLATTLKIYCLSIPLESLLHIYHRAFYSLRNTIIPSGLHVFTMMLMIFIAKTLAPFIGVYAIPSGFSAGLAFHVLILAGIFPLVFKKSENGLSRP